ncbi:radical SAM protein [Candidatus Pacearchaeota archaeon]|nr:radical SAM protein [Candidatus Pacearchaeota archaeon]
MENKIILPKLDLNVTNRCNFRCVHCAFDSGIVSMGELTLGELEKILSDTRKLGGRRIDITGGEPLLRGDVEDIISIAKKLGYKVELVTNASLLTEEKLSKFRGLGLDGIAISLDGASAETYNRIRRRDKKTFAKVLENIQKSVELGFYTKVNTVIFDFNLEEIPKIVELCLKLGVQENGIYYFTPIGRGNRSTELAIEPLKWLKFIRERLMKYTNSGMKISLEVPLIERKYWNRGLGCIANTEKNHLQILPDGNVYPCAILASYNKPVANLKQCSVKNIWNNKKLWRDYWKDISRVFPCKSCVDFKSAFSMKNYDFRKYRFVCPLRKFKLEELEK